MEAKSIISDLATPSDSPGRAENIKFIAYMVAPYRILKQDGVTVAQIRAVLEAATKKSTVFVSQEIRQQLDTSPDPFKEVKDISRGKEATLYAPPDFTLRHAADDPSSYHVEIHEYWYMKALQRLDAADIGSSVCAFDRTWFNEIDPDQHEMKFVRLTTIADGSDRCRFNFDRLPGHAKSEGL